ncbi:hypothetical protein DV515_00010554 [Chloebia gouldiae]|uniref:Uncharacterized protein n=1 Tax=Chloebia gouldiae TaxID=44316 RepID=A0A3L8S910_CHLGU|nr:hypothetical protein DV515_00010554 [Chloebia gouldiae]
MVFSEDLHCNAYQILGREVIQMAKKEENEGVPSSLYPLLKLSPKFVATNFRMMKDLVYELILENRATKNTSLNCKCNMQLCEIPCVTEAPPAHKALANTLQRGSSVHKNIYSPT